MNAPQHEKDALDNCIAAETNQSTLQIPNIRIIGLFLQQYSCPKHIFHVAVRSCILNEYRQYKMSK